ncbi:allatostatin-A receptor isoform X1 [Microplitis demolitor]|uniref:allatostatin-A receptor isoform X1 n=1 Tax=Microplitis demolitor TaxID=69319 RepID=UPI0004CCB3B6|nr:allatostatin-A receptor isoform X1 [Microplitis demolitor]XP_053596673.1 allatostatin-A receptor isoform X1 [Microplitis demolitor]XP_053596674.1 allatostatin-A receptor isoform X1 [Microplitis demolitor]
MLEEMDGFKNKNISRLWEISNINTTNCTSTMDPNCDGYNSSAELNDSMVKVVVPVFFGLIGFLGLVGNSLVVIVVALNPGMRSTTNILIINLAIADLLFVIFCIPFTATDYVLLYWPFGDTWCKMVQYLIIVTVCASVYTLVLMSLDRYLAVVHPIASMTVRTENHAFLAICLAWLIILTASIPVLIIHGEIYPSLQRPGDKLNQMFCRIRLDDWVVFQVTFFLLSYVIPLTLICGLYICMLVRLWRGARTSAESRRGRRRVTRLVIVVVGVFAFCWCPLQLILVAKSLNFYPLTTTSVMIQIASHVLAYMNSCVNPILYAFLSENFRKAFRKIIYCRPRYNPQGLGPPTKTTRAASSGDIL